MMKIRFICELILVFFLFSTILADLATEWDNFKHKYNKRYKTINEENERKQIFFENFNEIHSYQQMHPDATFTLAINHLSDRRIQVFYTNSCRSVTKSLSFF